MSNTLRVVKALGVVGTVGAAVAVMLSLGGCGTEYYKEDADKEVYQIIDAKWQEGLSSKANYRINDVTPSPNDVKVGDLPESGVLSLAEAVSWATAQNRDYQKQKEDLYLSALNLTLARHGFAGLFTGLFGGDYERRADDEDISATGGLGFSQLLADGAQISVNLASNWLRYLTGDPRTTLGSVLSATVTQPLLRGAGRKIVQENLTQAQRNTLYQIRQFNRFRREFVVSVVSDYYAVLQLRDSVINAGNNYESAKIAQDRVVWLARAGRAPRFEVGQAKQRALDAQDGYVKAQENYKKGLDLFKIRLAVPIDTELELDQRELAVLETAGVSEPNYVVEQAIEIALTQRLDLANTRDYVADAERKIEVAADALGMELNLIGSVGAGSPTDKRSVRLAFQDGTYSLGFDADLNLDRKAERNAYRGALISLAQSRRANEEKIDIVKLEVRQALRDLLEAATSYGIQQISLELAKQRVDNQELLLDAGRSTTRDLLEAQDDLLEAQNNRTSTLVNYTTSRLKFFRDMGILYVRPDGMWRRLELKRPKVTSAVGKNHEGNTSAVKITEETRVQ